MSKLIGSDRHEERDPHGDTARRRMLLSAFGGAAGLLAFMPTSTTRAQGRNAGTGAAPGSGAKAPQKEEKTFNAYDRTKSFTKNEMNGVPWVAKQQGNFDLEDPIQNRLARLKMTNNLVGQRTYIPMLIRLMIGREQIPGGRLLGAAGLFTWQLQEPDPKQFPDVPKGTVVVRSMYTARYLDPATMEPVDTLMNPFNRKLMKLEDNLFIENFLSYPGGGSKLIEEPQFVNDDPNATKPNQFKKWGDELVMFLGGTYSEPGIHQPRFTENMWASDYKEVMDSGVGLVKTRYTFAGLNKAYEKPWAGYTVADEDIICDLAYGKKVHSVEALPDFHKRVVAEKYPERL
jgi:hypothetical protein